MSLYGLPLLPFLLVAAATGGVVLILYTVRWRMPERVVSTTKLWTQVIGRRRGAGRLGPFEQLVSLLLQLVIAALLVLAAGQPRFSCQSQAGRAVVLVLDRSSSMGALERIEPRLEIARRRALERLEASADEDAVGLVLVGGTPLVFPLGHDRVPVKRAIETAELRPGRGHLERAVTLGCDLLHGLEHASLVVISDGSEPEDGCAQAQVERISVGTARDNVGITALETAFPPRDPRHAEAFVEVRNASTVTAHAELRLDLDGSLLRSVDLELRPGASERRTFAGVPITGAGRLVARLSKIRLDGGAADALADDDTAYAVIPRRAQVAIDFVGKSLPLSLALGANPRYVVTERKGLEPAGEHVTVIAGPVAAPLPAGRYLLVNPSGPGAPLRLGAPLLSPKLTFWRDEHPLLRRVVLSDVWIGQATQAQLTATATALAGSGSTPLLYTVVDDSHRMVGLGFELESSNFPLRVGFPVLIYNAIDWLLDTPRGKDSHARFSARTRAPVQLIPPSGKRIALTPVDGRVELEPTAPGFYALESLDGKPLITFAASVLSPEETALSPRAEEKPAAPAVAGRFRDREISRGLLLLALLLLVVEWFTFHRRVTV